MNKLIEYNGILFKVIPAHTGYAVSQCGKVLSRAGYVQPVIADNGKPLIRFYEDGGYNCLDKIVWGAWSGDNLFKHAVWHINKDLLDCALPNLRVRTPQGFLVDPPEPVTVQNASVKGYTILRAPNTAERINKRTKLTQEQVEEIVALLSTSELSQAAIAQRYGVCRKTISRIHNKHTWRWFLGDNQ